MRSGAAFSAEVSFDDNKLAQRLCGEHDSHLTRIEELMGVTIFARGNEIKVDGKDSVLVYQTKAVLEALYERLRRGQDIVPADIDAAARMVDGRGADGDGSGTGSDPGTAFLPGFNQPEMAIVTRRKRIQPRSTTQTAYVDALRRHELVFGLGPAGTGKTYLAVAQAVSMLGANRVERIVLSRPAVEAGERLGFLPGDLKEKIDPYLQPLYDALRDMLPDDQVKRLIEVGTIEIAPLAFMRGRTLSNAYVILDEAQNTTAMQMKMFLTRLGENSRMAVTGDISQVDLPAGARSGLRDALDLLQGIPGVAFVRFTDTDVVRHPLVGRIVRAYESREQERIARRIQTEPDEPLERPGAERRLAAAEQPDRGGDTMASAFSESSAEPSAEPSAGASSGVSAGEGPR